MAVAGRALQLQLELADKRLVVQQPGQLVVPGLVGELRGRAVEVRDHALGHQAVDRCVQALLDCEHLFGPELSRTAGDERPEHAPQQQELRHDLARRKAERLSLLRVRAGLRGERAAGAHPLRPRVDELA